MGRAGSKLLLLFLLFSFGFAWLDGWNYGRPITITEHSGTNLTDYQVLIELNSSNFDFNKAKEDGSDIRFTWLNLSSGKEEQIPYWIESWNSTAQEAKIWVKVPFIPAAGETKVYLYYGKGDATSESNGTSTFLLFEDFVDDLSDWICGTGSNCDTDLVVTNSYVEENDKDKSFESMYKSFVYQGDVHIHAKIWLEGESATNWDWVAFMLNFDDSPNVPSLCGNNCYFFQFTGDSDPNTSYERVLRVLKNTGSGLIELEKSVTNVLDVDTWINVDAYWHGSTLKSCYNNACISATDASFQGWEIKHFYFGLERETERIDYFFVTKYVNPEPTYTIGPEQTNTWWNSAWTYRRAIKIKERSGNNLRDYQVLVTLDTKSLIEEGKLRSDCGDLRFIWLNSSSDEEELIPYWIESGCGTNETKVWIKAPKIPANGVTQVYVYYGNPDSESLSNGDAVFEFFDDFEGTNLNTSKWIIKSGDVEVSDGWLWAENNATTAIVQTLSYFSTPAVLEYRAYIKGDPRGIYGAFRDYDKGDYAVGVGYAYGNGGSGSGKWDFLYANSGSWYNNFFGSHSITAHFRCALKIGASGNAHAECEEERGNTGTYDYVLPFSSLTKPVFLVIESYDNTKYGKIDWVFIRKFADPEPQVAVSQQEESRFIVIEPEATFKLRASKPGLLWRNNMSFCGNFSYFGPWVFVEQNTLANSSLYSCEPLNLSQVVNFLNTSQVLSFAENSSKLNSSWPWLSSEGWLNITIKPGLKLAINASWQEIKLTATVSPEELARLAETKNALILINGSRAYFWNGTQIFLEMSDLSSLRFLNFTAFFINYTEAELEPKLWVEEMKAYKVEIEKNSSVFENTFTNILAFYIKVYNASAGDNCIVKINGSEEAELESGELFEIVGFGNLSVTCTGTAMANVTVMKNAEELKRVDNARNVAVCGTGKVPGSYFSSDRFCKLFELKDGENRLEIIKGAYILVTADLTPPEIEANFIQQVLLEDSCLNVTVSAEASDSNLEELWCEYRGNTYGSEFNISICNFGNYTFKVCASDEVSNKVCKVYSIQAANVSYELKYSIPSQFFELNFSRKLNKVNITWKAELRARVIGNYTGNFSKVFEISAGSFAFNATFNFSVSGEGNYSSSLFFSNQTFNLSIGNETTPNYCSSCMCYYLLFPKNFSEISAKIRIYLPDYNPKEKHVEIYRRNRSYEKLSNEMRAFTKFTDINLTFSENEKLSVCLAPGREPWNFCGDGVCDFWEDCSCIDCRNSERCKEESSKGGGGGGGGGWGFVPISKPPELNESSNYTNTTSELNSSKILNESVVNNSKFENRTENEIEIGAVRVQETVQKSQEKNEIRLGESGKKERKAGNGEAEGRMEEIKEEQDYEPVKIKPAPVPVMLKLALPAVALLALLALAIVLRTPI